MIKNRVRAHALISGRVQGVFYRMETRKVAEKFGVAGWVRNLIDGRVEAMFEGAEGDVEAVLKWCHEGPRHAVVENVEISRQAYSGEFDSFEIAY